MLYKEPKVLACFHSFCKACLERQAAAEATEIGGRLIPQSIICQICSQETQLSPQLGIEGLLSDYGLENAVQSLGTSPYSDVRFLIIFLNLFNSTAKRGPWFWQS